MSDLGHTINVGEAAKLFKCSRPTIERMIGQEKLKAFQPGGKGGTWVIPTNQPIIQNLLNPGAADGDEPALE